MTEDELRELFASQDPTGGETPTYYTAQSSGPGTWENEWAIGSDEYIPPVEYATKISLEFDASPPQAPPRKRYKNDNEY